MSSPRRPRRSVPREPVRPRMPAALEPAAAAEHDLTDELALQRLEFVDLDLSGRCAASVDITQCRFTRATLAGATLERAAFTDCLIDGCDWANLRTAASSMVRTHVSATRLTGLHWVHGGLREVTFRECRLDFATFRFTRFTHVVFTECSLSRADFTGADLRGARFSGCDLTGSQFAQARADGTRFTRCDLAGLGSVANLAGAVMAEQDLTALSRTLAAALGIVIEE